MFRLELCEYENYKRNRGDAKKVQDVRRAPTPFGAVVDGPNQSTQTQRHGAQSDEVYRSRSFSFLVVEFARHDQHDEQQRHKIDRNVDVEYPAPTKGFHQPTTDQWRDQGADHITRLV